MSWIELPLPGAEPYGERGKGCEKCSGRGSGKAFDPPSVPEKLSRRSLEVTGGVRLP